MFPLRTASAAAAALLGAAPLVAVQAPISIDGGLAEWGLLTPVYTDPPGDGGGSGIDLRRLWLADDGQSFFVRVEVTAEIDLSEDNALRIFLDTDANSSTGLAVNGIGAELEWRFGERVGFYRFGGNTVTVGHEAIRFRAGPTVTGTEFEMAFGRDAVPDGIHPLFPGAVLRVVVRDQNGDQLPAAGQIITYVLDMIPLPREAAVPLARECAGDLRLVTYNVHQDGLWDPGSQAGFRRQLVAAAPDILSFQEVFGHTPAQTRSLIMTWLPPEPGGDWFVAGNDDCKTVSRHEILQTWPIDGNLALLIDTTRVLGSALLLINAHLPCCAKEAGRQEEIDALLSFLRDAIQPGGPVTVPPETPVVITGDLNLVGFAQQLESLLTGDVVDQGTYGPDFAPDWDATDLSLQLSRQTERRMGYTWRNDKSSFWPGHLDYFIFSDSVAQTGRNFILYTPEMSQENLDKHGLQSADSLVSDHLMLAADLRPASPPGDVNDDGVVDVADLVAVIVSWGPCGSGCPADLDGNGAVDVADLVTVLVNWT